VSAVVLRVTQGSNLPEQTGGDSEFDDLGPREARRTIDTADPGGLTIADAASGEVLDRVSRL